ncbi:MAG: 4-phosphoerythronate dehydrogenase, partial [Pseudomonadota bacterium]
PSALRSADVLLVRSVTTVNQALLQDSSIQFVGTATIGVEHVDVEYLHKQNIGFASAPGSNANAVSEYVLSSLLCLAETRPFSLLDKTVGIIGHGNVGSLVAEKLKSLGVSCLLNDPPRAEVDSSHRYVDLDTVLSTDILTMHVPLVTTGRYPTYRLANQALFDRLAPDAIFINTSRGNVVDESALLDKLSSQPEFNAVLDVWQNEPNINLDLLQKVTLATPHIASYSLEGKLRGTSMLYQAVCRHFDIEATWPATVCLPEPSLQQLGFSSSATSEEILRVATRGCYDPRQDDAMMRRLLWTEHREGLFDNLRKNYILRREFDSLRIKLSGKNDQLEKTLSELGFAVHS